MVLNIVNNPFHYEMEKLTMAFFPESKITVIKGEIPNNLLLKDEDIIKVISIGEPINNNNVALTVSYLGKHNNVNIEYSEACNKQYELIAAQLLYKVLSEVTGITLSWGVLTGVRPSKLMHKLINEMGEDSASKYFTNQLLVTEKKTKLAKTVARAEQEIMSQVTPDSFSLYISIPFCPTRCSYCSFVSSSVSSPLAKKIIPEYFDNLLKEVEETAKYANKVGIKMMSAYIGGGTPGILSPLQTEQLLNKINTSFDMSNCKEFTFEAGRPDTITLEKLTAAFQNGANRISINPQTMQDSVLESVGRRHTEKQVYEAFEIARQAGFKNINMDLIAGLPTDTVNGFEDSVSKILDLEPENVTVHTLAYKRSADLAGSSNLYEHATDTAQMVDTANIMLYNKGYVPYYMYRQTKSVGNLENVGYCKPSFESVYNIFMMEECHTILACGAGAVIKLKDPFSSEITRVFNFKYPYEYNDRFEEILKRKQEISSFYARRNHGRI